MPPRSADRSITTCRSCRRRKIRCDRARPRCNRCRESGATCLYETDLPQPPLSFHFVAETPGAPAPQSRRSSHGSEQPNVVTISSDRLQSIEARIASLSNMVRRLQAQSDPSSVAPSSGARSTTDVSTPSIAEPEPSNFLTGHLSQQDDGKMRYVESTFWASMCNEVAELDQLLSSQARYLLQSADGEGAVSDDDDDDYAENISVLEEEGFSAQRTKTTASSASMRLSPHQSQPERLVRDVTDQAAAYLPKEEPSIRTIDRHPEFLLQLPPRAQCDMLIDSYVRGYHAIVPLVHIPTFRGQCDDFWSAIDDKDARSSISMSLAALLVAICYAGSVSAPDRAESTTQPGPTSEEISLHLQRLGIKALRLANFPKTPTLDTFIAYLVLQATWMREEEPLTCVAFVGLALRVATMLGLHRDPQNFGNKFTPIEAEVRRRVWWQVVHIDVLVAIASGLPPLLDLKSWDVKGISELKEEYLGTLVGTQYELAVIKGQRPHDMADDPDMPSARSMVSTAGVFAAGKLRYSMVLRKTMARLYTDGPLTTESLVAMRSEFRMLGEDLAARIGRIPEPHPSSIGNRAETHTFENNPALNRWARLLLSGFIDEMYTLVGHSVLKNPISQLWPDLYPQAIERCQSFCMKSAQLAAIEDFKFFQWSWPGNHQPLHAVIILLVDLIRSPDTAYATHSRLVIDIVFALLEPNGGMVAGTMADNKLTTRPLSEGGQETWKYLRRLRIKAWQGCGLDPKDSWTREAAIQYCNSANEPEVMVRDPGPMWSQASPEGLEELAGSAPHAGESSHHGSIGNALMSPPDIDWAYFEDVLGNASDDGLAVDPDDPQEGSSFWR